MVGRKAGRWGAGVVAAMLVALVATSPVQARERAASTRSAKAQSPAPAKKVVKNVRQAAEARRVVSARRESRSVRAERPARAIVAARPSFGQLAGLHTTLDPLSLKSSVAYVLDQDTHEVLLSKNPDAVLPIASITKLMTALVVTEAGLSLDDELTVTQDDVDTEKGSHSRLYVGATLTRGEMLHLALMSSENRAAHALGRAYPGGLASFVDAMNVKAKLLGMQDTHYVEPTGLSSDNQSSARDLATLVNAAYQVPLLRELSTSPEHEVSIGSRAMHFRTTNGLVKDPSWDIGLQKTGYISEAGRCLVMQATMAGRKLIMVFLDSAGRYSRIGDAERVRRWVTDAVEHADHAQQSIDAVTPSATHLPGNGLHAVSAHRDSSF